MNRCWLALADHPVHGALASARVCEPDGAPAGVLAFWSSSSKPRRGALRVDARIVDPDGDQAWISLVLAPGGVRLPFDDPSVQQARRRVLERGVADGVSTLLRDDSHFAGAVTVARGAGAVAMLTEDPFALVSPARLLRCEAGAVGRVAAPTGPAIERYGSANPWPWDRFE